MTTLYFSFFHSYLNYGNIAWASTTKSKLRKIASQQRQAVNAIPKNDNQEITNSRKFMEENGILNVYKLNLCQVLNFMFRVHNETIQRNTRIIHFAILSRRPHIWNSLTNNSTKIIDFCPLFKITIKENLLKSKLETNYF